MRTAYCRQFDIEVLILFAQIELTTYLLLLVSIKTEDFSFAAGGIEANPAETELYFLGSRYYDPEVGRFISPDQPMVAVDAGEYNLYAYCGNDPVNFTDPSGYAKVKWWQWALSGTALVVGTVLVATGVGAGAGIGLIVAGSSMLLSNSLEEAGVDSKLAMQIQSGAQVVAGIALMFVPGAQSVGASLIGGGVLSFAGGYISEACGGSYELGWSIGNIVGSIAGGMAYKGIINRLNSPANMMKSFSNHPNRWKLVKEVSSQATGKAYSGGTSVYSNYRNVWTGGRLGTHIITRGGIIIHGPHFHPWI